MVSNAEEMLLLSCGTCRSYRFLVEVEKALNCISVGWSESEKRDRIVTKDVNTDEIVEDEK